MDPETSQSMMLVQIEEAKNVAMAKLLGWRFEIGDLVAYVELPDFAQSRHVYLLRATFDDFPMRAPSYVFVDPSSRIDELAAWPPGVAHSRSKICTPGTREFHEDLHRNDRQYTWDADRYKVISTIRMIHRLMGK